MFKNIFVYAVGVFLFYGCSFKKCGIEEDVFKTLSQNQKDSICAEYSRNEQRIALERAQEAKARAEKEAMEAAMEQERIQIAYRNASFSATSPNIIDVEISGGVIRYGKREYRVANSAFSLVEHEVKRVPVTSYDDRNFNPSEEIWFAYQNHRLFIGVHPDVSKSHLMAYLNYRDDFYFGNPVEIIDYGFRHGEFLEIAMKGGFSTKTLHLRVKTRRY